MEKARLTREQAEELERIINKPFSFKQPYLEASRGGRVQMNLDGNPIITLNVEVLAKLLFGGIGYEIIEEDQVVTVTAEMQERVLGGLKISEKSTDMSWKQGFQDGVTSTLEKLSITIKGINA